MAKADTKETIDYEIRMAVDRGRDAGPPLVPGARYVTIHGSPRKVPGAQLETVEGLPLAGIYVRIMSYGTIWKVKGSFYQGNGEVFEGDGLVDTLKGEVRRVLEGVDKKRFSERTFEGLIKVPGKRIPNPFPQGDRPLFRRGGTTLKD